MFQRTKIIFPSTIHINLTFISTLFWALLGHAQFFRLILDIAKLIYGRLHKYYLGCTGYRLTAQSNTTTTKLVCTRQQACFKYDVPCYLYALLYSQHRQSAGLAVGDRELGSRSSQTNQIDACRFLAWCLALIGQLSVRVL